MAGWKTIKCPRCATEKRVPQIVNDSEEVCDVCNLPFATAKNSQRPSSQHFVSYQKLIRRVDAKSLIQANQIFNEARGRAQNPDARCVICEAKLASKEAVRLTNGSYVCESCFEDIKTVKYPEIYQARYECFLAESEAHRQVKQEFESKLRKSTKLSVLQTAMGVSQAVATISTIVAFLMVSRLKTYGFAVSACCWASMILIWRAARIAQRERAEELDRWNKDNLPPVSPVLKEFCDPNAQLSQRDRMLIEVFDYWPGYPPYWTFIRAQILKRDGSRCQITGCPSRTELHIHHSKPLAAGGSHKHENLITLCVFHHGLQPEPGHERVWGRIQNDFFSMVRAHLRNGFPVRAHVRRKELADKLTLETIAEHHGFGCSSCKSDKVQIQVDQANNEIQIECSSCGDDWSFDQKLPEESGPQIAETLKVARNHGRGKVDWSLLETIRKPRYRPLHKRKAPDRRTSLVSTKPKRTKCPKCGSDLDLKKGKFGNFYGCTSYPECRYTKDARPD